MDKVTIVEEIRRGDDLLSLPQALTEILKEVDNPDFTSDSLARIILKDPALTARMLRLANSSYYHRMSDVKTVQQAVTVLGVTTVKCLALSSSLFDPQKIARESGVDCKKLFASILTVASGAEQIARALDYKAPDEAFVAGLLHHIGIIFLLYHHSEAYRKVVERQVDQQTLVDAERAVFGIDHCEVGYHLAVRWRLPDYVAEAVQGHHMLKNEGDLSPVSDIIRLACSLASDGIDQYDLDLETRIQTRGPLARRLEISDEKLNEVAVGLRMSAVEAAKYLGVDIGNTEEMLTRANREIWQAFVMVEQLFKERQTLSAKLLSEEHTRGAIESKNIAIATLSHYLNNATMAISGHTQLARKLMEQGDEKKLLLRLPASLDVIESAARKIVAVVQEMKDINPIDDVEYYNMSMAMKLDDRIKNRIESMDQDSGLELPEEALDIT